MKEEFINKVCGSMASIIDGNQLAFLRNILYSNLDQYNLVPVKNEIVEYTSDDDILKMFIVAKKIDGLSDKSLYFYSSTLQRYLHMYIKKPVSQFTKDDLRMHFAKRMIENPDISKVTINNERRIFSSFFTWLFINNYISSNPMVAIKNIKVDKIIKEPFSEMEIEKMRDFLVEESRKEFSQKRQKQVAIRNLAIFEFLLSTGCRISELTGAKLKDLDLHNKECKVFGKGSKERICYLNALSVMRLEQYLEVRGESKSPYIFIGYNGKKEHGDTLDKGAIECMIRDVGNQLGIKAHPHKFRRTCATMLLNKGMPIEQVQIILGHNQLDTTLIYAQTNRKTVKMNHEKYM